MNYFDCEKINARDDKHVVRGWNDSTRVFFFVGGGGSGAVWQVDSRRRWQWKWLVAVISLSAPPKRPAAAAWLLSELLPLPCNLSTSSIEHLLQRLLVGFVWSAEWGELRLPNGFAGGSLCSDMCCWRCSRFLLSRRNEQVFPHSEPQSTFHSLSLLTTWDSPVTSRACSSPARTFDGRMWRNKYFL